MSLTIFWIGMSIGAFLYHWGANDTFRDAIDSSYNMGATLFGLWIMMKIKGLSFSNGHQNTEAT